MKATQMVRRAFRSLGSQATTKQLYEYIGKNELRRELSKMERHRVRSALSQMQRYGMVSRVGEAKYKLVRGNLREK
jgi:RIO-like serine/threonine protein kinase